MIANIVQSRDSVGSGEEESRVHYVVLRLFMFVCLFVCLFVLFSFLCCDVFEFYEQIIHNSAFDKRKGSCQT